MGCGIYSALAFRKCSSYNLPKIDLNHGNQSGFPIVAPMALNYPNPAQLLSLCEPQTFGCNTFAGFSSYATRVPGVPLKQILTPTV